MKVESRHETPPQIPEEIALWSIEEVKIALRYKSTNSIYSLIENREFPKPIKMSKKKNLWRKRDVIEWMAQLESA